ncbi:hypothetical protein [Spirosoma sordidisoli]|uniref:Uncharacterized protein n=1 Tax=Spirosoma sordidisoli TaxID=2502893 RepID=A0A4Q2UHW9_9BACT|nr:hypothetical protein [Spirosoma sordidisoli]RYC66940.1 hypothetical protein EQG79_26545 [Spirosoma sordidisoli]
MASSEVLLPAAKLILEKKHQDLITQYTNALAESIKFDTENVPPRLSSAQDISDDIGVSIADQVDCLICLTRKEAQTFLKNYGKTIKGNKLARNFLNIKNYEKVFSRPVCRLGNKDLVFTYAEVQYLVQYGTQLVLPEKLK